MLNLLPIAISVNPMSHQPRTSKNWQHKELKICIPTPPSTEMHPALNWQRSILLEYTTCPQIYDEFKRMDGTWKPAGLFGMINGMEYWVRSRGQNIQDVALLTFCQINYHHYHILPLSKLHTSTANKSQWFRRWCHLNDSAILFLWGNIANKILRKTERCVIN